MEDKRERKGGMGEEGREGKKGRDGTQRKGTDEPMRAKEQREAQEKDVTKPEMGAKGKG